MDHESRARSKSERPLHSVHCAAQEEQAERRLAPNNVMALDGLIGEALHPPRSRRDRLLAASILIVLRFPACPAHHQLFGS